MEKTQREFILRQQMKRSRQLNEGQTDVVSTYREGSRRPRCPSLSSPR